MVLFQKDKVTNETIEKKQDVEISSSFILKVWPLSDKSNSVKKSENLTNRLQGAIATVKTPSGGKSFKMV